MTTQNLALFKAIGAKMEYLSQRQRIISQNIANADTPGYRPQDLTKADFGAVLKNIVKGEGVTMDTTNPGHMPNPNEVANGKEEKQKKVYEVAPAGNSVILEEQMINSNETAGDYALMLSLYQKNVHMIKMAMGGG